MTSSIAFGRYELLRKLASGGMAEIYLARQWGEGGFYRDVVIKRLYRHLAEHERTLAMFQYEARLLAELGHPNVPQVFDLGFADGYWYLALEFVNGYTVAEIVEASARAQSAIPLATSLGIVSQLCEALHHAHERVDRGGRPLRIVHRDVTPHNIMVTRDGVAKVLDFGVAQTAARRESEPGVPKGTFSYMAPEQVRGRALDKRADVFAVGVILYELTTGMRLFSGTDIHVMTSIVEQDVVPPTQHYPDYPVELEAIVMSCLHRDRARRMPSAAHVAVRIEEFALRYQLITGPRAVARYLSQLLSFEANHDSSVAMVSDEPRLEVVSDSEAQALEARTSSVPPDPSHVKTAEVDTSAIAADTAHAVELPDEEVFESNSSITAMPVDPSALDEEELEALEAEDSRPIGAEIHSDSIRVRVLFPPDAPPEVHDQITPVILVERTKPVEVPEAKLEELSKA